MRAARCMCLILLLAALPNIAMSQDILGNTRFELGIIDDRLMMILTQTAPLVQQFTGFTAAVLVPFMGAQWGEIRLDWTAAFESGLAFDSTGLARWFVRAAEQDLMNERTGQNDPPPPLTAGLIFGTPLYLPLRFRTEAELGITSFLRLQLGLEAAGVFLFYPPDVSDFHSDVGITLGLHFTVGRGFGVGLRGRIANFGDLEDRWPGFGVTVYLTLAPFLGESRSE